MIGRYADIAGGLPLVVCPDGSVLGNPTEHDVSRQVGLTVASRSNFVYDVAVVGAGPAGLSTAVYGCSEGPVGRGARCARFRRSGRRQRPDRELLRLSHGHQRSGADRPRLRAGAEIRRRHHDPGLGQDARLLARRTASSSWRRMTASASRRATIVVASGARYRHPAIPDIARFEGRGIWYWASQIEARLCAGEEVIVVGGGNSAGQGAVFLSGHASKVRMMVQRAEPGRQHVALSDRPDRRRAEHRADDRDRDCGPQRRGRRQCRARAMAGPSRRARDRDAAIRNVFLFVGADPATEWLQGCVTLDKAGFVTTGVGSAERRPCPLAARVVGARRVRGRRRARGVGQAGRRGDRRRRRGRRGDP